MSLIDAILFVLVGFSILVALGMMREALLLRNQVTALEQLVTKPVEPSYVGSQLPVSLSSLLHHEGAEAGEALVFLTDGCGGCHQFADDLRRLTAKTRTPLPIVAVVASDSMHTPLSPNSALVRELQAAGYKVIRDENRSVFAKAEVFAAPSVLLVDPCTSTALAYSAGGDLEWLRQKLGLTEMVK
jgi:hypothetical protein